MFLVPLKTHNLTWCSTVFHITSTTGCFQLHTPLGWSFLQKFFSPKTEF